MEKDYSTEEKIINAARKIFQQKGFAATRTRDIAEEAGINLALLNYYFRSKEKLFEIVMEESVKQVFSSVKMILNSTSTSLTDKIDDAVNMYINMLAENPNMPIFILGEIQANPEKFKHKQGLSHDFITNSILFRQLKEHLENSGLSHLDPLQMIINLLSMVVFPFIGRSIIKSITNMSDPQFQQFIEDRRVVIPLCMKNMLHIPTGN